MRLSTRSRYGARLLLDLAQHQDAGPVHLTEVAQRQELPLKYLEQIIIPLRKAGIIQSVRGPKGGHLLARPPEDIRLAEVVSLLEEGDCLADCVAQVDACRRAPGCVTRLVWQEAGRALYDKLHSITLADLVKQAAALRAQHKERNMYSPIVMEHFNNPRNAGVLEDADGVGEVGNPACGDMMTFYIKVEDDTIVDVKFQTFGCVAAIAVSSMVSELAKGKKLAEAEKISNRQVAEVLGGLPKNKLHCSNLGADALALAIKDYRKKQRAA
jgi:nitrogen fixation NifU-like protein